MSTVKEEARKLVEALPDNADGDDIIYEFYVRQKIARGLAAEEAGRTIPHEEIRKRFSGR